MGTRKQGPEPALEDKKFASLEEIDRAISKLIKRLSEMQTLATAEPLDKHELRVIRERLVSTLREIYGLNSVQYSKMQHWEFWDGPMFWDMDEQQTLACERGGVIARMKDVEGLIETLNETAEYFPKSSAQNTVPPDTTAKNHNVFIVHGRDEAIKEAAARLLQKLNCKPIILHEQPNEGRTLIEKFEKHADVGFAVIVLTPDDVGGLVDTPSENLKLRARQNVVLELGYFMGKLGRNHICVLHTTGIELPSDILGVAYVAIDPNGLWKFQLAKELQAANFPIDLNQI